MKKYNIIDVLSHIGEEVELYGWVDSIRDHRKIVFIDLRDRTGIVQVVGGEDFKTLSSEDVIYIKGLIKKRPEQLVNPKLPTGTVEIEATSVQILGKAKQLPLPVGSDGIDIDEEVRLKYRYLDLRRFRMGKTLKLRSDYIHALRGELHKHHFTEVETPMLTKATKEGARDFLVPSRLQPGTFYALPQSPQQYKQLLMVAGVERYFQFAKCIRDEDLRADRGFEHTQLDMEMSFVEREDVMNTVETIIKAGIKAVGGKLQHDTFPVINYNDALSKYGADKFDLRTEQEKKEGVLAFAWVINFPFFKKVDTQDRAEIIDGKSGWTFTHNPFSMPLPQHLEWHLQGKNIEQIITSQYDLVCNGFEAGGGSIRAHKPEILEATYKIMGYSKEETISSVGHMLEAFSFGTPPHGGIGMGLDRQVMLLAGQESLKEAIAFPMNARGKTAVMDAPSIATDEQLEELGIQVVKKKKISVFDQIVLLLQQNQKKYKLIEHKPVFTSEESALIRKTQLKQGAKALVMFAEEKPLMIVLSADKKLDMNRFKNLYQIKKLRMATPEEVKQITNVEIGAVPPFANIFEITLYVDKLLGENSEIVFNAGSHTKSILMQYQDFEQITKPIIGMFSKDI